MPIRWTLFRWQFRQLRWISYFGSLIAMLYVLLQHEPLQFDVSGPVPIFILLHCTGMTWILGRVRGRSFGWLYVQGFSRDALWLHTVLACLASTLVVWLPSSLLIWLGARSYVQDAMGNYWYPLMAETDLAVTGWSLLAYLFLLAPFHYVWIRGAQPTRGTTGGLTVAIGAVLVAFSIWNSVRIPDMPVWIVGLIVTGLALMANSLTVGGFKLHRRIEVMS